jgi:hypothetical protein
MMQKGTIVLAAGVLSAAGTLLGTTGLARAESPYGPHRSWWDQVEKAQTCAMGGGNPYAYSLQSPCISTPPAAYRDAQRAYPEYYRHPAYGYGYGYGAGYPGYGYGYGAAYPPYRYGYGAGY